MKLKTLRDLNKKWMKQKQNVIKLPSDKHHLYMRVNHAQQLKAEAVKWIKKWELELDSPRIKDEKWTVWVTSRIDLFREFFNLTDEDLKEVEKYYDDKRK